MLQLSLCIYYEGWRLGQVAHSPYSTVYDNRQQAREGLRSALSGAAAATDPELLLSSEMALEAVCQSACWQVHNDTIAQDGTSMVPGQALFLLVNAHSAAPVAGYLSATIS